MADFSKNIKLFWPFCFHKESRYFFIASLAVMGTDIGAAAYLPYAFKNILEALENHNLQAGLLSLGGIYLCTSILVKTLTFVQDILFYPVVNIAVREIHFRIPDHIHNLSMEAYKKLSMPKIISYQKRVGYSARAFLRTLLVSIVPTFIKAIVSIVILLNIGIFKTGLLTGIALTFVLFFLILQWYLSARKAAWQVTDRVILGIGDNILNTRLVRYYKSFAQKHMRSLVQEEYRTWWRVNNRMDAFQMLLGLILGGMAGVMIVLGALAVQSGTITLGDFVLMNGQLTVLLLPLRQAFVDMRLMCEAAIDIEKIADLFEIPAETPQTRTPSFDFSAAPICFENVSFSYGDKRKLFEDFSLSIKTGEKVLIHGVTGVGKSTLVSLMTGLLKPQSGRVRVFGEDTQHLSLEDMGKILHFIPQDNQLFNASLYENLTFGVGNPTKEDIEKALALTLLTQVIARLPHGLDTEVGEMGAKLSGGEKQRLALARALLLNPKILIFDETTNAMDMETERQVFENIEKTIHTLVFISHRVTDLHHHHKKIEIKQNVSLKQKIK